MRHSVEVLCVNATASTYVYFTLFHWLYCYDYSKLEHFILFSIIISLSLFLTSFSLDFLPLCSCLKHFVLLAVMSESCSINKVELSSELSWCAHWKRLFLQSFNSA